MNEIKNVRIDSRLIHGQVVALWSKALMINRLIVIDQEVVKDDLAKTLLKAATPSGIKLSIISPQRFIDNMSAMKYQSESAMVIVKGIETLEALGNLGYFFDEVVVGNVTNRPGTKMITQQIYLDEHQVELFKKLSVKTRFEVKLVPTDLGKSFLELL